MRKMLIQCSLSWKIGDWKCKKCDFDTHSEGLLRQHKVTSHNLKESKQKIIVGYELDMQKFANVLGEALTNINVSNFISKHTVRGS